VVSGQGWLGLHKHCRNFMYWAERLPKWGRADPPHTPTHPGARVAPLALASRRGLAPSGQAPSGRAGLGSGGSGQRGSARHPTHALPRLVSSNYAACHLFNFSRIHRQLRSAPILRWSRFHVSLVLLNSITNGHTYWCSRKFTNLLPLSSMSAMASIA